MHSNVVLASARKKEAAVPSPARSQTEQKLARWRSAGWLSLLFGTVTPLLGGAFWLWGRLFGVHFGSIALTQIGSVMICLTAPFLVLGAILLDRAEPARQRTSSNANDEEED